MVKINFQTILAFCIILVMCQSMQLLFTWPLPTSIVTLACALAFVPYLLSQNENNALQLNRITRLTPEEYGLAALLVVNILWHYYYAELKPSIVSFVYCMLGLLITIFVLFLSSDFKGKLYRSFDLFLKVICVISIVGWFLLMAGFPLPHYHTETNDYYNHEVYYLFLFNIAEFEFLPRFAGMFLEPGHLGSTACLMLYINRFNFRKPSNWIYLLSLLMSFSLAAYCLFFIGLFLHNYLAGKAVFKKLLIGVALIGALYIFALTYNEGNNDIYNRIFARLEFVNGEMVGNNRTSPLFDSYYNNWLKKGNPFVGFGVSNIKKNAEMILGTAGYQRFVFFHGLIGAFLVLALYLMILWRDRSRLGLGFFLLCLVNNCIRDYPYREMWLYIYIFAIPMLAVATKEHPKEDNESKTVELEENAQ